jgi:hypothetical protein
MTAIDGGFRIIEISPPRARYFACNVGRRFSHVTLPRNVTSLTAGGPMRAIAPLAFAVLLLVHPRPVSAHEIFAPLVLGAPYGTNEVTFGLDGFHLVAGFDTLNRDGVELLPTISGVVTVDAALNSIQPYVDPSGHDITFYTFGTGLLTIDAYWTSPVGGTPDGPFEAPVAPFAFQVIVDETTGKASNLFVRALPGVFDDAFKDALLMNSTVNFDLVLLLNNLVAVDGDRTSSVRTGTFNLAGAPRLRMRVPEPAALALVVTGLAGWLGRRRRSAIRPRSPRASSTA